MDKKFQIIIIEDLSTDVELAIRELRLVFDNFNTHVVDKEQDFLKVLSEVNPDLILSDYFMPEFNGMLALEIAKKEAPFVPFILLTGSTNEDTAVKCMRNGADDYVIKEHIKRLGSAILNAIEKKKTELEKHTAIKALKVSEEKYRSIMENLGEGVVFSDLNGKIIYANQAVKEMTGMSMNKIINSTSLDYVSENVRERILQSFKSSAKDGKLRFELPIKSIKGENRILLITMTSNYDSDGKAIGHIFIFRDISEQKEAEEKALKLSKAVEQSPDSIVITDKEGLIEYTNPSFSRLTGFTQEEVIGLNPNILKSGEHDPEFYSNLWNTILTGKTWFGEINNKKKNGELYWEKVSISPVVDDNSKITHFVSVKQDITEYRKMVQDLTTAKEKAEESDKLKSAFIANISHEIRTPMNGILGFTNLMRDEKLAHQRRIEYISIVEGSSKRMLKIINGLIDLAKIETGQIEINPLNTNVNDIIEELFWFYKPIAEEKSLQFNSVTEENKLNGYIDFQKIIEVLGHLIDNAIKFTPEGEIKFGYKFVPENHVTFFVQDSGIGIPAELRQRIFERFLQADNSLTRMYEGAGMGLSISKALVELMGGKLELDSNIDIGSKFYFTIPLQTTKNRMIKNKSNAENTDEFLIPTGIKIIIADDDKNSYLLLNEFLKAKGITSYWTKNGIETLKKIQTDPEIVLILMDLRMPDMDGLEATKQIKKLRPDIPVIAITAFFQKEDKSQAYLSGCDEFLSKPINVNDLLKLIAKYIGR